VAKIKIETLPLIRRDSACALGEMVLEVEEAVQEAFELVEFANVHVIGELVEKFDERSEPLDSGFEFGLEDLDAVFDLNFLEVDEDRLQSNWSSQGGCGRRKTIGEEDFETGGERLFVSLFAFGVSGTTSASLF
jgi:hypothetical protein